MRPIFTVEEAKAIPRHEFGIEVDKVAQLDSYDDQNFFISSGSKQYVLKISNSEFARGGLEMQNTMMNALHKAGMPVPRPVKRLCNGEMQGKDPNYIAQISDSSGAKFDVRLVTFLPGKLMAKAQTSYSPALLKSIGRTVGQADQTLMEQHHPAANGRGLEWDLENFLFACRHLEELGHVQGTVRRRIAEHFIALYETRVKPILPSLRKSVIHSDFNDYNICISDDEQQVTGFFDFGDMVHSSTINDIAIAAAYALLGPGGDWSTDPLAAAEIIVCSYHEASPVPKREAPLLYPLICARLTQSVLMSAHSRTVEPDNEYLGVTEGPAWCLLEFLVNVPVDEACVRLARACGFGA